MIAVRTLADLTAVKDAALSEYRVKGRIGSYQFTAIRSVRNGSPYVFFMGHGDRRTNFNNLCKIVGYLND